MAINLNEENIKRFLQGCSSEELKIVRTQLGQGCSTKDIFEAIVNDRVTAQKEAAQGQSWLARLTSQKKKRDKKKDDSYYPGGCGAAYASSPADDMTSLQWLLFQNANGGSANISTSDLGGQTQGSHSHSHTHDDGTSHSHSHSHSHDSSPANSDGGWTSHIESSSSHSHSCHSHGCSSSSGSSCGGGCGGGGD